MPRARAEGCCAPIVLRTDRWGQCGDLRSRTGGKNVGTATKQLTLPLLPPSTAAMVPLPTYSDPNGLADRLLDALQNGQHRLR